MLTLDTSAILALLNTRDSDHDRCRAALESDPGPYIVPAGIIAEAAYMVEQRMGADVLDAFLADLEERTYMLECGEQDLARIRDLVRRYSDLPLGFADASVVACAERNDGAVLTLDRRDFDIVGREQTIRLLP
jgi:uncharacterized protein